MRILYNVIKRFLPQLSQRFYDEHPANLPILLTNHQKYLFSISREYPSIINNGYRHIEVAIALIKKNKLDQDYHIIDVGGAAGKLAKMLGSSLPNSTVHSFEPIKHSFERLSERVKALPNIKIYNYALGSQEDEFEINIATRITSSSLYETNSQINDPYFAESLKHTGNEKVKIKKLDDQFHNEKISLIKLDVQGFELEVLKGATETLKRTHFVLTEVMNHNFYTGAPAYFEIDAFLRNNNFKLLDIMPSIRKNDKLMEWDATYYNTKFISE